MLTAFNQELELFLIPESKHGRAFMPSHLQTCCRRLKEQDVIFMCIQEVLRRIGKIVTCWCEFAMSHVQNTLNAGLGSNLVTVTEVTEDTTLFINFILTKLICR